MSRKRDDLAAKIQRAVRSRELGKKHYARADMLMAEIAKELEPGQVIKISAERAYQLEDKFAGTEIVWTPCAARRWNLKEVAA